MSAAPRGVTSLRVALLVVRVASLIVPADLRDEWRRAWRGELWARSGEGGPLRRQALGSLMHAFWLRWDGLTMDGQPRIGDPVNGDRVLNGRAREIGVRMALGAMIFEVDATDPSVFGTVTLILLFATWIAGALPAHRASRIHPATALRERTHVRGG